MLKRSMCLTAQKRTHRPQACRRDRKGHLHPLPGHEGPGRADGDGHGGVLLILSLVYYLHLDRTGYSDGVKWLACRRLPAGILAQSGGFFVHLGLGQPNRSSLGTAVTRLGALLIAAALIILAMGLLRSESQG